MRRVEWALRRRRRKALKEAQQVREGENFFIKAARRISELATTYDSEEEEENGNFGPAGVTARRWTGELIEGEPGGVPTSFEPDDYGEEVDAWLKEMRRTRRRVDAWGGDRDISVYSANVQSLPQPLEELQTLPPVSTSRPITNGSARKSSNRKRDRSSIDMDGSSAIAAPTKAGNVSARAGKKVRSPDVPGGRDLNDEITQDLLAERSDEDMDGDESGEEVDGEVEGDRSRKNENDHENEESDVDMA